MVAAVLTGFAQVLLAAGRPAPLFRFNICVLAVYAGAVWVTASHGIVAVAIAVVGVYLGMLVAVYGVLFPRVVGIPTGRMVGDLVPAVAGSSAILALGFPLRSTAPRSADVRGTVRRLRRHRRLRGRVAVLRRLPRRLSDRFSFVAAPRPPTRAAGARCPRRARRSRSATLRI